MNTKKTLVGLGIIAGLVAIGFGIAKLLKEQVRLLFSYCYRIKNVYIKSFKMDNVSLTLDILLRNQSDISLEIQNFDIDVYLEDVKVTSVKDIESEIVWKAKGVSLIPIAVNFSPKDLFKQSELSALLSKAAYNYKQIKIRTVGTVSVKHSFISAKNVPIDMSMTIDEIMQDDPTLEKCTV